MYNLNFNLMLNLSNLSRMISKKIEEINLMKLYSRKNLNH